MNGIDITYIYLALILLGCFLVGIGIFLVRRKQAARAKKRAELQNMLKTIPRLTPREQIMKYDIVLDQTLDMLGYRGTLGEKLKQRPLVFRENLNTVWRLHKLRNTLAHSLDEVSENLLMREAKIFHTILGDILQ